MQCGDGRPHQTNSNINWDGGFKFAADSSLEEAGFEPLVPRQTIKVSRATDLVSA